MPLVRRNQGRRGAANTKSAATVVAPPPPIVEDVRMILAILKAQIMLVIQPEVIPVQAVVPANQGQQISKIQVIVN